MFPRPRGPVSWRLGVIMGWLVALGFPGNQTGSLAVAGRWPVVCGEGDAGRSPRQPRPPRTSVVFVKGAEVLGAQVAGFPDAPCSVFRVSCSRCLRAGVL